MLGRSIASHDRDRVVYERTGDPAGSGATGPVMAGGNAAPLATAPAQKEPFGASLLRAVLWLMIRAAIGAALYSNTSLMMS